MRSTNLALVVLLLPALPVRAAVLQSFNGARSFILEKTAEELEFHARGTNATLKIRECNRKMVEEFWREAVFAFERLPRASIRGKTEKPYISLDSEKRWILPMPGTRTAVTPQAVENLRLRSHLKCKS